MRCRRSRLGRPAPRRALRCPTFFLSIFRAVLKIAVETIGFPVDNAGMKHASIAMLMAGSAAVAQAGLGDKLPLDAYRDPIDRQIAETGKGVPGRPLPCTYEETQNGVTAIVQQPTDICVRMSPQQHFRGLWRHPREGSRFCPEPATSCSDDSPGEKIWLSGTPGRGGRGELYRVDFIGRKTMFKGPYSGFSDEEIVMDRAIRIELIEPAQGLLPDRK